MLELGCSVGLQHSSPWPPPSRGAASSASTTQQAGRSTRRGRLGQRPQLGQPVLSSAKISPGWTNRSRQLRLHYLPRRFLLGFPATFKTRSCTSAGQTTSSRREWHIISYNTYPGWHLRNIVREMMIYHVRKFDAPEERAAHARGLLDVLVKSTPAANDAYGLLLRNECESLQMTSDSYWIHEHLESHNEPLYFHEFMARADAHGLQFLGESDLLSMWFHQASPQAGSSGPQTGLERRGVEEGRITDFLRNRTFRKTLLCRKGLDLRHELDPCGHSGRCTSPAPSGRWIRRSICRRRDRPVPSFPTARACWKHPTRV